MAFYDDDLPGVRRSSGLFSVFLVSTLVSALVSVAAVFALARTPWFPGAAAASNKGQPTVVPRLLGMSSDEAKEVLKRHSLRLVVEGEVADVDTPPGHIAEQNPLAGSDLPPKSAIRVKMSTGPAMVVVPDLQGKSPESARELLEKAGLRYMPPASPLDGGVVSTTQPSAGSETKQGSAVQIVLGPGDGVLLPSFKGQVLRKVREKLSEMGLKVGKVRLGYSDSEEQGVVLSQQPAEGTTLPKGSTVDFTVND